MEVNLRNFDPKAGVTTQVRTLMGPARTGAVTYDVPYTDNENARWLYFGTTGNVSYVKWDGTTETLPSIASGVWHPIPSLSINTSGTTIAANQIRWGS